MADSAPVEIFDVPGGQLEVKAEPIAAAAEAPSEKHRAKREITAERKAQLLAQLKKGRETITKNREAKKKAKTAAPAAPSQEQPPTEKTNARAPTKPSPSEKPSPTKNRNDHSDLITELKGLREEIALSRTEKRERAAAKRKAEQERSQKAVPAPKPEPARTNTPPAAAAAPKPLYVWCGRTGKRILKN